MNNPHLISIIIPCYNSEATIGKCLESIICQDYDTIEIVIIDDGSTDNTSNIINDFKKSDHRIIIHTQENSGVSKARNIGIGIAAGEYICFVDSDDWVEKNYCSVLYKTLIENKSDISIVDVVYEDEKGNPESCQIFNSKIFVYNRQKALELLLEDKTIKSYPCAKLFSKEIIKNISFPEELEAFEDYFTLFKIFNNAKTVVKINKPLYHYIQFSGSLSHNLTPKRAYHFFSALIEVFNFLQTKTVEKESENLILKNILKKSFMVLKRIIRNTNTDEMTLEKENVRDEMKAFLQYSPSRIGIENYLYLRFFIKYPKQYQKFLNRKKR